jgi:hypothetical protein
MAVEKALEPGKGIEIEDDEELDIEVLPALPEEMDMYEEEEDGSVVIDFSPSDLEDEEESHYSNLAEYLEEEDLQKLASQLEAEFEADQASRRDWAMAYAKGLDLLGMKIEERNQPFEGASGVYHPMLTEAVVRFQAQAMGEIFPASGPARSKILGEQTPEKIEQAHRVEEELNYQLTEKMTEYRDETEQMLFQLALAGSAFKKVYFDHNTQRPASIFVPAEDFVAPYGASDLGNCERYTQVMRITKTELLKRQVYGYYRDVDIGDPVYSPSDVREKYDELAGESSVIESDDRYTLLEMHVSLDMEGTPFEDPDGIPRPYVVTMDKSSGTVLCVKRNWDEEDENKNKRMHFVHYKYLPGMGFYGTGLIHLVGGIAKSATSIMRQLLDAGTLANLPGGLKAKGLRVKGDTTPINPGEWRDADVMGMTLRESLFPLPYKEPSPVLHALLADLVNEGRRIGSVADIDMGSMGSEAPVGTTLALLERNLKVMSGVHARLHAAMKKELRLISRLIYEWMDDGYDYDPELKHSRVDDFDGRVDVIPVSDPNASTMAQKVIQYQAAMQMAQGAPHLYNMGKLHRGALEVLNIKDADEIVKLPDDIDPMDPVTENMAILKQEPVKAFAYQDHAAHIQVHMAAAQDPKIQQMVGQSPFAGAIQASLAAHVTEHVAMQYRVEIQKQLGVEMPDPEAQLPEDIELQVSRMAAEAADKLLRKNHAEAIEAEQRRQEKDPLTIIQRKELELKERDMVLKEKKAVHDGLVDMARQQLSEEEAVLDHQVDLEQIRAGDRRVGAEIGARIATQLDQRYQNEKSKGADIALGIVQAILQRMDKKESVDGKSSTSGAPKGTS